MARRSQVEYYIDQLNKRLGLQPQSKGEFVLGSCKPDRVRLYELERRSHQDSNCFTTIVSGLYISEMYQFVKGLTEGLEIAQLNK